ncbi:MAG: hypothetical protein OES69_12535 [Myxococcales bacterium]|nr:hypothetical protein [Myxococcales bacterium]MDH3844761.1 hypothetical protein [Myxococcales bacterium]
MDVRLAGGHFNVTDGPSAHWTGQQLVKAFPYDSAPKYIIRDQDKIVGADFVSSSGCAGNPAGPNRIAVPVVESVQRAGVQEIAAPAGPAPTTMMSRSITIRGCSGA